MGSSGVLRCNSQQTVSTAVATTLPQTAGMHISGLPAWCSTFKHTAFYYRHGGFVGLGAKLSWFGGFSGTRKRHLMYILAGARATTEVKPAGYRVPGAV